MARNYTEQELERLADAGQRGAKAGADLLIVVKRHMPILLWQMALQPLNEALIDHTTRDDLRALRAAALAQPETPPAVIAVLNAYIALYEAIEGL